MHAPLILYKLTVNILHMNTAALDSITRRRHSPANAQQPAGPYVPSHHAWPPQQPLVLRGVHGAPPAMLLLPLTADARRLASFFPGGTSRPGLRLKKPKGLSINPVVSTGITGKSSGRTMCLQQHQPLAGQKRQQGRGVKVEGRIVYQDA